jgi:hypothetical protein
VGVVEVRVPAVFPWEFPVVVGLVSTFGVFVFVLVSLSLGLLLCCRLGPPLLRRLLHLL